MSKDSGYGKQMVFKQAHISALIAAHFALDANAQQLDELAARLKRKGEAPNEVRRFRAWANKERRSASRIRGLIRQWLRTEI